MNEIRYVWVDWAFNKGAWSQAVGNEMAAHGKEFVGEILGVSQKTVQIWSMMYDSAYGDYPYPNMTNFMTFCNTFNYDPREFFVLAE